MMFVKAIGLPCFLAANCMIFLYNTRQYPRYTYRDYKPGGCDRGLAGGLRLFYCRYSMGYCRVLSRGNDWYRTVLKSIFFRSMQRMVEL